MKTEEKLFTFLFLAVIAVMVFFTFDIRSAGSRLAPLIVGGSTLVLMLLLAAMALFPGFSSWYRRLEGRAAPSISDVTLKDNQTDKSKPHTRRKEIAVVGWLVFLTMATYVLGFMVGVPLFLFLFLKFSAKEKWIIALGMPIVVSLAVYFIFIHVLQIPLHEGIFTDMLY